ncbi:MAG: type II secretion system protein [bacterium]|nr:type II secretion system protein [bacterium]
MRKKGFTLVELLAVISILAILVVMAIPNVIKMFNNSKKSSFETEVKTIIQSVERKWLSDATKGNANGEIVYCRVDGKDCENSLQMSSSDKLDYYVKVDAQGNILQIGVTNKEHQFISDKKGIKATDVKEASVISQLPEEEIFKVTADGITIKDKLISNKITINNYGFYYDVRYETYISVDYPTTILFITFKEDGTLKMWIDLSQEDYNKHKSLFDADLGCSNYECAKVNINYILGDINNGLITTATTYSKSNVYVNLGEGETLNFDFTQDGRSVIIEGLNIGDKVLADIYIDLHLIDDNVVKTNEYGFIYNVNYVGENIRQGYVDSKLYITFKEDGTVRMWEELGQQDYYKDKEYIDADLSCNNYECAKATWNYIWGDKENGMVTNNTQYNQNHVYVDYNKNIWKYELNFYFSRNGRRVYIENNFEEPIAYYK